eukprot:TRINITY_DN1476_c0_g2_i3.p2 TRINITY_DN1476_c0_g2~~TRINITY_DN1476_c0_g2_i3.p2  ORF type:complete len:284 (-),score=19.94 TRINITY_DN1476_c0_g2_i3:155-937(-)
MSLEGCNKDEQDCPEQANKVCADVPPNGPFNCDHYVAKGFCEQEEFKEKSLCAKSCKFCGCVDEQVNSFYTCDMVLEDRECDTATGGGYCLQTCGKCSTQGSVNGTNQSQADNIETQQQSANQVCNKTQNGCNCQRGRWKWDGNQDGIVEFYWGCAKTLHIDRPWCPISDASDCELEPVELRWDYCDDYCVPQNIGQCVTSQNGCDCISPWMYGGVEQRGCTRPDAEVQFSWCVIDESSCDAGHGLLNSGEVWDRCPSNC